MERDPGLETLLQLGDGMFAILSETRRVLALNQRLLRRLGIEDAEQVLGLRLGNAVSCVHAADAAGCGTGPLCASCGVAVALAACSQDDQPLERRCAIESVRDGSGRALYLGIRAQPLLVGDRRLVLLFLRDIQRQQDLAQLERVLLHDVGDRLRPLLRDASALAGEAPPALRSLARDLHQGLEGLSRELTLEQILLAVEQGSYQQVLREISTAQVFAALRRHADKHPQGRQRRILFIEEPIAAVRFTDQSALLRVLSSMLSNAIEASEVDDELRVVCERRHHQIVFSVSNPQALPPAIDGRIFQRNFSTKGAGRGLGTYSMKLFGERLLGGRVSFQTSSRRTTFLLELPLP